MTKYKNIIGTRAQVMHETAKQTGGGLRKKDLKYNKRGKIVSKKASKAAKKSKNLIKAGYITKKGHFGTIKIGGMNLPHLPIKNEINNEIKNIKMNVQKKHEKELIEYNKILNNLPPTSEITELSEYKKRKNKEKKYKKTLQKLPTKNLLNKGKKLKNTETFNNLGGKWVYCANKEGVIDNLRTNLQYLQPDFKLENNSDTIVLNLPNTTKEKNRIQIASKNFIDNLNIFEKYLKNLPLIETEIKIKQTTPLVNPNPNSNSNPNPNQNNNLMNGGLNKNLMRRLNRKNTDDLIKELYEQSTNISYIPKKRSMADKIRDSIRIWTQSPYQILVIILRRLYFQKKENKTLNTILRNINLLSISSFILKYVSENYNIDKRKIAKQEKVKTINRNGKNNLDMNTDLFEYQYILPPFSAEKDAYSNIEIIIYIICLFDFMELSKIDLFTLNKHIVALKYPKFSDYSYKLLNDLLLKEKCILYRGVGIDAYEKFRKSFNINKLLNISKEDTVLIPQFESYATIMEAAMDFANRSINKLLYKNELDNPLIYKRQKGVLDIIVLNNKSILDIRSLSLFAKEAEVLLNIFTDKNIIGKYKLPLNSKIIENTEIINLNENNNYNKLSGGHIIVSNIR